jgi:hypothetical protein
MPGSTSREILRFRYLPESSEERWVSLLCFFLSFSNLFNFYVVFYLFIYISFFCIYQSI